jgi:hypothetical protein
LLRAVYSVFDYLDRHGRAAGMRFAALNFSDATIRTSWQDYHHLDEIKKALFTWQGNGTRLDCGLLDGLTASSCAPFLCLMVSDGQIVNTKDVLRSLETLVALGHDLVLIQIGVETPLVAGVRALGISPYVIADAAQLEGLVLACSREHLGEGPRPDRPCAAGQCRT